MHRCSIAILVLALAGHALALPSRGEAFPGLAGRDVTGKPRLLRDLLRADRTLVVAISDRDAAGEMRRWFEAADERAPASIGRISVVSLELPFFVGEGTARRRARSEVPERWWGATLLDVDGAMAEAIGLPDDELPSVFVLDAHGRVLASARGAVERPAARGIWDALAEGPRPAGAADASEGRGR